LIQNLENRSAGNNLKAIQTASVFGGASATYLSQETCFKATEAELSASGHLFIVGIDFL